MLRPCLSVCLSSVIFLCFVETNEAMIMRFSISGSKIILVSGYSAQRLDSFARCVRLSRFSNALEMYEISFIHLISLSMQRHQCLNTDCRNTQTLLLQYVLSDCVEEAVSFHNGSVFTAGPHCLQCNRCICYGRVCPSVCPPSHSGVLSRRMKLRSCGFHYQVAKSF